MRKPEKTIHSEQGAKANVATITSISLVMSITINTSTIVSFYVCLSMEISSNTYEPTY
jgi:hypothetical protein